jgi:hypothetical protein
MEFTAMFARSALISLLTMTLFASGAFASDGEPDAANAYPAVGFYHVAFNYPGEPVDTYGGCSGSLISPRIFLTAAHCTFYDSRRLVEQPAYERAEAWASFDPVVSDNDFRCHLRDIGYPGAHALACDQASRNHPTFHKAFNVGITHPSYASIKRLGSGALAIREFAPGYTDIAVLLLENPIQGIDPLPLAAQGLLDDLDRSGLELVGVGYGLNYHKSIPATPEQPGTAGPTNFVGDYGVRRVAQLGGIRSITPSTIVPRQQNALGDDSVCYWDSGSPLFRAREGVVDRTIIGVLTGGALWCMGAYDPYQRVDIPASRDFLQCVAQAPSPGAACECGVEGTLGLCER